MAIVTAAGIDPEILHSSFSQSAIISLCLCVSVARKRDLGLRRRGARHGGGSYAAVGLADQRRRVQTEFLAAPPQSLAALGGHVGEPVLPQNRAQLRGRLIGKGIGGKQG